MKIATKFLFVFSLLLVSCAQPAQESTVTPIPSRTPTPLLEQSPTPSPTPLSPYDLQVLNCEQEMPSRVLIYPTGQWAKFIIPTGWTLERLVFPDGLEGAVNADLNPCIFGFHEALTLGENIYPPEISSLYGWILGSNSLAISPITGELIAGQKVALPVSANATVEGGQYLPVLTPADVVLPIGPEVTTFIYKPCYVWTETQFHAGDGWYYSHDTLTADEYIVYAPIAGTISKAEDLGQIGYGIDIKTIFSYNGKRVFLEIVHTDGLLLGITVGTWVEKGQAFAHITQLRKHGGRYEALVDIGFRNGPPGANILLENWNPDSYFDPKPFYEDNLISRSGVTYEYCTGNPIP